MRKRVRNEENKLKEIEKELEIKEMENKNVKLLQELLQDLKNLEIEIFKDIKGLITNEIYS